MPATRLHTHRVEKPWGRHDLWPGFADPRPDASPIGEIWFQADDPAATLLVKYLFTSERLSIQVHPDDAMAQAAGHPRGKDEAWVILDAAPDSTIALGPVDATTPHALRAAACDGSIVDMLDWRPVKAGDMLYSPARTIHAIGAGITLIEVQQNVDLTYRLYDYGRPRALHLDAGIAASTLTPAADPPRPRPIGMGRAVLVKGPKFVLERWSAGQQEMAMGNEYGWFVPITGQGEIDGQAWHSGECWMTSGTVSIALHEGDDALFAYSGSAVRQ